ncbi:MAG: UDP-N-acetylmuramoyl-L-alanine--D-glutamate ligase [Geminicoccaceae bacterium]|nr:UDP-N-acetylmuramoyl-L-alanine--D-glutamate ligase [Geminicoccaceae bacterium]
MPGLGRYRGRKVGVLGLARSGLAAARALAAAGAVVLAYDDDGAKLEASGLTGGRPDDVAELALLVPSPGVPLTHPAPHPVIAAAQAAGVPVVGDVQLFVDGLGPANRLIGVTGTNGKSTTSALIHHLLQHAGVRAVLGGNIGRAVFDLGVLPHETALVLELSSYQLDLCQDLRPDVAVWLNMAPDHLDRHGDMDGYLRAKRRLFDQQRPEGIAVVGTDDPLSRAVHAGLVAAGRDARAVAVTHPVEKGAFVRDGVLHEAAAGEAVPVLDLRPLPTLRGAHNHQNAAAAYAALRALGLKGESIVRGFATFPGLPHRMEEVARIGGVRLVNDSKATNPDAAMRSLGAFENVFWIAGGRAKPGGFCDLRPHLGAVRRAFLIGEAAPLIARDLGGLVPCVAAGTLEAALDAALDAASGLGEVTVLLAPACASFDQFRSFEHRGDAFRALARAAAGRAQGA